ncbi:MAG: spermidine synthase [Candidatus Nanopelagicales bacterium]
MARRRAAHIGAEVAGGYAELLADPEYTDAWLLLIDGAQQSHVNLANPAALEFEYVRRIAHLIDTRPPGRLRVTHLGGGGLTLPRYVSHTRPASTNVVVEIDEALMDLVRTHLPMPREYRVKVRIGEARAALNALPAACCDVLICDVFDKARTPGPLTSIEAFAAAKRALAPEGLFIANIADERPLDYARRFVAGVAATWPEVGILVDPTVIRGRRFGNFVVGAADAPLPEAELARRAAKDVWPARLVAGRDLTDFLNRAVPFTDQTATGSPEPPPGVFGPG